MSVTYVISPPEASRPRWAALREALWAVNIPLHFLFTRAMASVLDGIRGKKAKEVVNIIAMPDDEYSLYLAEVQSPKPKQQKT